MKMTSLNLPINVVKLKNGRLFVGFADRRRRGCQLYSLLHRPSFQIKNVQSPYKKIPFPLRRDNSHYDPFKEQDPVALPGLQLCVLKIKRPSAAWQS